MFKPIYLAAAVLVGLATSAQAREFKEFKDIVISCTDGLTCSISLKVEAIRACSTRCHSSGGQGREWR